MREWVALPLLVVAACSTVAAQEQQPPEHGSTAGYECRSEGLDAFAGRDATAEVGKEVLTKSGAKVLRWLKPGQIVTMEFRFDRVNIHLDANNKIERVTCG